MRLARPINESTGRETKWASFLGDRQMSKNTGKRTTASRRKNKRQNADPQDAFQGSQMKNRPGRLQRLNGESGRNTGEGSNSQRSNEGQKKKKKKIQRSGDKRIFKTVEACLTFQAQSLSTKARLLQQARGGKANHR